MGDIEYRILGSVEALQDGSPAPIGAPRQRAVLAALLLEANRVVSVGRLVRQLWGSRPPHQARRTVQSLIHRVRKALSAHGAALVTRPPGYQILVPSGSLDLSRFDTLVTSGRDAMENGRPELAAATFRRALALWRGDPFADAAGIGLHEVDAPRLLERRLQVVEDRVEADLALYRHGDLIAELPALIAEHPVSRRSAGRGLGHVPAPAAAARRRAGRRTRIRTAVPAPAHPGTRTLARTDPMNAA
jgi:DNA-binding SARP family transcriptional activator